MKLRIQGNSVRLRLSKPEIETFGKKGYLEEVTQFGSHTFTYALNKVNDNDQLFADFNDGLLILHIPHDMAQDWIATNKVGLEHNQDIDGYHHLHLLVEKDFKCIGKETDLDQRNNFDNPNSVC